MSWCSQWRLRLMWVVLDPVQTLLVDSLKVRQACRIIITVGNMGASKKILRDNLLCAAITPVNQEELNLQMRPLVQDRTVILNIEFQVSNPSTTLYYAYSFLYSFTATNSLLLPKPHVQLHNH